MIDERNAFRAIVGVAALVPVGGGLAGALLGAEVFAAPGSGPVDVSLDSHVRYLSGLLLGIGLAIWATLPEPERHGARYRLITAIVMLGGAARLVGMLTEGLPDMPMTLALGMELLVMPLICLWQARLARRAAL